MKHDGLTRQIERHDYERVYWEESRGFVHAADLVDCNSMVVEPVMNKNKYS